MAMGCCHCDDGLLLLGCDAGIWLAGMRYVVDAGRSKQKILQEGGSMAQYDVRWVSKASAQQRAGRSGRTGPGHCYRSTSLQGIVSCCRET